MTYSTPETRLFFTYQKILGNKLKGPILDIGSGKEKKFVDLLRMCGLRAYGFDKDGCNLETEPLLYSAVAPRIITANAVIEHVKNFDFLFRQVYETLRPDGLFIVRTPNADYCGKSFWNNPDHKTPYSPSTLKLIAEKWFDTIYCEPGLICRSQLYNKLPFKYWIASKIKNGTKSFIWIGRKK